MVHPTRCGLKAVVHTMVLRFLFVLGASFCFGVKGHGTDLDNTNFESLVLQDKNIWAVEFSSSMCGSCQAFAPEWDLVVAELGDTIRMGRVLIDKPEGLEIAQELNVMDEGIPNIQLFSSEGTAPTTVMAGSNVPASDITSRISSLVQGREKGGAYYLKASKPKSATKKKYVGPPSLNPDNPDNQIAWNDPTLNFYELASNFDRDKKYHMVIRAFRAAAKHDDSSANFMNLGVAYMRDASFGSRNMEHYLKAEETFKLALEKSGGVPSEQLQSNMDALKASMQADTAYNEWLLAKSGQNNVEKKTQSSKKKYVGPPSLNPDNPDNQINWDDPSLNFFELAQKFDKEKKPHLMIRAFRAAVKQFPDDSGGYMNLGVAYMRDASFGSRNMEHYLKAEETFKLALEKSGGVPSEQLQSNMDVLKDSMDKDPEMAIWKAKEEEKHAGASGKKWHGPPSLDPSKPKKKKWHGPPSLDPNNVRQSRSDL